MKRFLLVTALLIVTPAHADVVFGQQFGANIVLPSHIVADGQPVTFGVTLFDYPGSGVPVASWYPTGTPQFYQTASTNLSITGYFLEPGFITSWQAGVVDEFSNYALVCPCEGRASILQFAVAPAVPEPASWVMLLLGFCGVAGRYQWKSRYRTLT